MTTLPVSEIFGPTFQGEGPHAGCRTGFLRLGLCNLTCEWCDTPYTWDHSRYDVAAECPPMTVPAIHEALDALGVETMCLSGGEPLMHKAHLRGVMLPRWTWHVETNGTIPPPPWWAGAVSHTTVSPKVTTRDPEKKRLKPRALAMWNALADQGSACFKFVVGDAEDLGKVQSVVDAVGIAPANVWIMPEGTDADTLITRHQKIEQAVSDRGWNTTTRLHVLLYGQERCR